MAPNSISMFAPVTDGAIAPRAPVRPAEGASSDVAKRFEQMLWAEMLSYAGLEESFTRGGGEAASAFSRYIVEAIAADLAETHPLGLGVKIDEAIAAAEAERAGTGERL